jgi:hypothetical protein
MSSPISPPHDAATAAERIQRRWRHYRRAVEDYEVAAAAADAARREEALEARNAVSSAIEEGFNSSTRSMRRAASTAALADAAERIQRQWRLYRCEIVNAEAESRSPTDSPPTAAAARSHHRAGGGGPAQMQLSGRVALERAAAARIQATWRGYAENEQRRGRTRSTPVRSTRGTRSQSPEGAEAERERHANTDAASDTAQAAVVRIQRRWKHYRQALAELEEEVAESLDATASSIHAASGRAQASRDADEAAGIIQRLWRIRHAPTPGHRASDAPSPSSISRDESEMTSPTDAAARRIQRLWKRYRDAVESYEDAASSAGSTHEDLAEAAEVIQRRWREYLSSTRRPAASNRAGNDATTHERSHDDDDDGAAQAHAEETEANARDRRLDEIIATLRPPDMAPHDAAAMMIQMWWRVRGRETPSPLYDSTHDTSQSQSLDSAPSPAHRRASEGEDANHVGSADAGAEEARRQQLLLAAAAFRQMRARVEFRDILQQVRERDRNRAAVRLQEAWRQRRNVVQHRRALLTGRRDNAARSIQAAFRRFRGVPAVRRSASSPTTTQSQGLALPRPRDSRSVGGDRGRRGSVEPARDHLLPTCIVCLDEIVQIALLPCGHAHLCEDCSQALRRCPMCRVLIAVRVRIFL